MKDQSGADPFHLGLPFMPFILLLRETELVFCRALTRLPLL